MEIVPYIPTADEDVAFQEKCVNIFKRMLRTAKWGEDLEVSIIRRLGPPPYKCVQVAICNPDCEQPVASAEVQVKEGEPWLDAIEKALDAVQQNAHD